MQYNIATRKPFILGKSKFIAQTIVCATSPNYLEDGIFIDINETKRYDIAISKDEAI